MKFTVGRRGFLIVYGQDPDRWAKRYGLEPFTHTCELCGAPQTTSIAFAVGQLRGLLAPRCPCGSDQTPYCLVRDPKYGDLLKPNPGPNRG